MTLWEFALTFDDGTQVDQTVLAEGANEVTAASAAAARVVEHDGLVLVRPGKAVPADVGARWAEVYGEDAFPEIVPKDTRMSRYARGRA